MYTISSGYCTLLKDQLAILYFLILHLTHIVEHAFYYGMTSNAHCRVYGTIILLSTEIVIIHYNDYHLEGHINEVHRQTVFLYSTVFQPDHSQGIAILFDYVDCLFLSTRVRRPHSLSTLCCLTFGFYFMLQVSNGYSIGSCFVWLHGEGCALFSACFYMETCLTNLLCWL